MGRGRVAMAAAAWAGAAALSAASVRSLALQAAGALRLGLVGELCGADYHS